MIFETGFQMGAMQTSDTKTIEVVLNGEPRRVPQGFHVAQLLDHLSIDPAKVAVELNRSIVRKPEWSKTPVNDGAEIEVVWFVGGGSGRE
jgi:thiamine biosynthesis protein ThiS